jgi:signal transduction histidine kinase
MDMIKVMNDKYTFRQRLARIRRKLYIPNLSVRLTVTFVCLLLFAKLVEKNILFPKFDERHAQRIQNIFTEKEQTLLHYMDMLGQCVPADSDSSFIKFHGKYAAGMKKHGLYLFVYRDDALKYWSTKDVAAPETYSSSEFDNPYVSLGDNRYASGKYASFVKKGDGYEVVGLALIKNVYTYENKYLKIAFQKDFRLPASVKIYSEQVDDGYPITDSRGRFVWSLIFDSTCIYSYQIHVPALAYLLAIMVLFMLLNSIFNVLRTSTSRNLYLPALAFILTGVRYGMQHWQIPEVFYELELFKPIYFGSGWFPSFGELCLWCIFICFFVFELYRYLKFPLFYERRWKYFMYLGISLMIVIIGFFGMGTLLKTLVINSSDIFEGPNRILRLNGFSLLGYAVIMLFLASFCLLLDKMILLCKQELTYSQFLISYIIILSMAVIGWSISGLRVSPTSIFFLTVLVLMVGKLRLKRTVRIRYSHYILLIFIFALFTSVYINRNSYEKYEDQKKILVTNLASQHDLTAEFLLRNISDRIISDTSTLADVVYSNDYSAIVNYIKKQYFYSSYWNKYFMPRCWVCGDTSQLLITGQKRKDNCVRYFKFMTDDMGSKLPRSEFWYIDRQDAVSTYLGWFRVIKEGEPPLQLFIELWPGASEEVGYLELLLDDRLAKGNNLKGYSYAKYRNNRRMTQYGNYKYNLEGDIFQTDKRDYHTVYADGMEHLVYRPDKNSMIVLSSYSPKPSDLIINFSYIFIFFFIVLSICLLIFYLPVIRRSFQWNFHNKIQYSMIAVMLVSLAVIGAFTIIYVNRQYRNKNNDIISEKMKAIHTELQDAILLQKNLDDKSTESREILAVWLVDFQRLFFTDINLFDVHGQLIATSLPDIFDKGMVGRQINPNAYIQLSFGQRASIIEHEEIGGLHYISAYEPFVDNDNRVIAFLNLPYFTQQDALSEEISNVVMALLNFYMVIILLTVIVSVVMSNQITQPLMMLQEKFRNIKLGEKNEPIPYESHDEVGGLVKEYNRAIEELARSASSLARSERESAWREMAKQIAHEINNPLTPMKLSIQHLKRAYDNKSERFDMYMEKISRSLVEQIDTLSAIATEFSNFAKMPATQNEMINLIDKINNVVPLFAIDDNKRAFRTDFHGLEHAMICADKEQMSRVFINLFKNALQAIPKDRQAEIHIDVLKINRIIWVRIKDNGTGIPEEMQGKIFRPNFTTKSSGMGVGLSIVRSIIEGAGGSINFKTRQDEGTTFMISLPSAD